MVVRMPYPLPAFGPAGLMKEGQPMPEMTPPAASDQHVQRRQRERSVDPSAPLTGWSAGEDRKEL